MGRAKAPESPVLRVALTGGIASGKSTVAKLFTQLGAKLIDTDHIAREVVVPGSPVLAAITQRFGPQILLPDGSLDRTLLRKIVFKDDQARADLEALTHPAIRACVDAQSVTLGGPYQLIAVPLLVEKQTQEHYDRVLVIDTDPALQLRRLMLRDQLDEPTAQRMIAAQALRETRLAAAHDVILNDGDIGRLASQVEKLHLHYLRGNSQSHR
jgi:dephospho-CoA kinase